MKPSYYPEGFKGTLFAIVEADGEGYCGNRNNHTAFFEKIYRQAPRGVKNECNNLFSPYMHNPYKHFFYSMLWL